MKVRVSILVLCATVITTMVTGCNMPEDTTGTSKPNSTLKAEVKDDEVTKRVQAALAKDETLSGFDITVATLKGDVRLTGSVNVQNQIDYVNKLVRSIDGVHSIHDELAIKK
jgi:hyperosmotically inducible protein